MNASTNDLFKKNITTSNIRVLAVNYQDCSDMHHWGPGMRPLFILHHVLKGCGYLETSKGKFKINAGECFLIWPYTMVYYYPDPDDPWTYAWVDFEGDNIDLHFQSYGITPDYPIITNFDTDRLNTYGKLLRSLDIYNKDKNEADALMHGILFTITTGHLDEVFPKSTNIKSDSRLYDALRIIKSSYHRSDFKIENISTTLNINKMMLYRMFKDAYNMSAKEYLTNYRMLEADKMLRKGASIKETAFSCGFEDPLYFSKAYKKVKGYSPSHILEH